MPELPLFDGLTHPMPDGNWLQARYDGWSKAGDLVEAMSANAVRRVLAVGLGESVGGYQESAYADWVQEQVPGALPVGWFGFTETDLSGPLLERMQALKRAGYAAIKIHPRLCGIDFRHPRLPEVVMAAHESGLPVLLCTYNYQKGRGLDGTRLDDLLVLLDATGGARIMLLHGGVFHCLEWAEAVRPYPEVLLDLSFTMSKFAGSSLDLDIRFLFGHFDQRICVGSDHPELTLKQLRARFDQLSEGLPEEKAVNIAHGNLNRFFGLEAW
jgi:predicted TIM-barrel fold metal-dependent hydrolase